MDINNVPVLPIYYITDIIFSILVAFRPALKNGLFPSLTRYACMYSCSLTLLENGVSTFRTV